MKKYTIVVFLAMFFISCNPQVKRISSTSQKSDENDNQTDVLIFESDEISENDDFSDLTNDITNDAKIDKQSDFDNYFDEKIEKDDDFDSFAPEIDFSDDNFVESDEQFPSDLDKLQDNENQDENAFDEVEAKPEKDDFESSDNDEVIPENECTKNEDCNFGYSCNKKAEPFFCEYANKCETDEDCTNIQKCKTKENWKECVLDTAPSKCSNDDDCEKGEYCKQIFPGFKKCVSKNKCENDEECPENYSCKFNGDFYECKKDNPCQKDEDCGFGYECEKHPDGNNVCNYVNECVNDKDCKQFESCVTSGNHTVCKFLGGGVCSKDSDCPQGFYCDKTLGFAGKCETKNQCYKDSDCKDGFVCKDKGSYNECVPKDTNSCFVDAQCKNGLKCINNKCMPSYTEMCPEIAGFWTVWLSTIPLIKQSDKYEFIPKKECTGDVKKENSSFSEGTFKKTSNNNFDLKMYLFMNCTAKITLNSIMSIDCGNNQTAQLGRTK